MDLVEVRVSDSEIVAVVDSLLDAVGSIVGVWENVSVAEAVMDADSDSVDVLVTTLLSDSVAVMVVVRLVLLLVVLEVDTVDVFERSSVSVVESDFERDTENVDESVTVNELVGDLLDLVTLDVTTEVTVGERLTVDDAVSDLESLKETVPLCSCEHDREMDDDDVAVTDGLAVDDGVSVI